MVEIKYLGFDVSILHSWYCFVLVILSFYFIIFFFAGEEIVPTSYMPDGKRLGRENSVNR